MALVSFLLLLGIVCFTSAQTQKLSRGSELKASFSTMYFTEPLDHINGDPGFITIKTLYSIGDPSAPLFVYTGDNNAIEMAYTNAGWITDILQPTYNASVIFIEHRFYGDSQPSNAKFDFQYLTTTQALLDFADIVQQVRPTPTTPVIAIGGVYGGMMAAFFRIKFPHIVDGAVSSSAPFLAQFDTDGSGYARTVSNAYKSYSPTCASQIQFGFNILDSMITRPLVYNELEDVFRTCQSIDSPFAVRQLEDYISAAFKFIAEYNYPYISNVLGPLPPSPINVTCLILENTNTEPRNIYTILQGMYEVANVFYNYTGRAECHNITNVPNHGAAWIYQTCTELVWPEGQYGPPNDIFPVRPWNYTAFTQLCENVFGVIPRPEWPIVNFGMSKNANETLEFDSNFIFTYGQYDPFRTSCFSDLVNFDSLVSEIRSVPSQADLRSPSPQDPQALIYARNREQVLINQWINNKVKNSKS